MSTCPKCKQKLALFDWKPKCPHCGVNLMLYGFEEKFYEDAKLTEMGNAKVRVWFAGVKAALFGGKIQIVRLVFCLLPVIALLLPYADFAYSVPMCTGDFSLGLLGVINAFGNGVLNALFTLKNADIIGAAVGAVNTALIAFFAAALFAVLGVVCEILCFVKIKAMTVLLCVVSALGIVSCAAAQIFSVIAVNTANNSFVFNAKSGFGVYAGIISFVCLLVVNILTLKKGINVEYKEGDLLRVETAKRIKRKEITLNDIPFPIYETPEEKQAREAAVKATLAHTDAVANAQQKEGAENE